MSSERKKDRTARLLRVAQILYQYPQGVHPQRIAELCGVSRRTVYRDLVALQGELGYPVWQQDRRYGLDTGIFLPPLKLNLLEAMALFLSARLVSRYSDESDPNIQSAFSKLAAVLPTEPSASTSPTPSPPCPPAPRTTRYARVFDILTAAWAGGRRVRIWYPARRTAAVRVEERLVEPYFLEPSPIGHSCYLIAHCHHAGALRTFKLERIQQIELTDQPYAIPSDFDANAYLKSSWGIFADEEATVELRFSPAVASRVEECTWHPSQRTEPLPDGGLHFTVTVAGTVEITPWILAWGAEVEVLAPPELRSRIAETARVMASRY